MRMCLSLFRLGNKPPALRKLASRAIVIVSLFAVFVGSASAQFDPDSVIDKFRLTQETDPTGLYSVALPKACEIRYSPDPFSGVYATCHSAYDGRPWDHNDTDEWLAISVSVFPRRNVIRSAADQGD